MFRKFETVRHGDKKGEDLSEAGIERAKKKAEALFEEIRQSPPGTVLYLMPSNIGRAIETRNVMEQQLIELAQTDDSIEFISVHDAEKIKEAAGRMDKKYVITEIQPSLALGFNKDKKYIEGFQKYRELYKGNEEFIGLTWAAHAHELDGLRQKIKEQMPEVDVDTIKPADFRETPEEVAITYVRFMRRMAELTNQHFPGHPWKGVHVGHNIASDFAAIGLLGRDISVATVEELGGKFREYIEPAHFELEDGKISASYRNLHNEQEIDLESVITDLEMKAEIRRKEWNLE